jgi:hypothetical protein
MSPAMRHKIAVMGGKAAALKRRGRHKFKVVKKALKKKGKQLMGTRFGKALRGLGRGLKAAGRGVKAAAGQVHAAYQTAKAQETTAQVGKALKAARKGGDKELVRALSMMQQGLGRGDAKRVKAAAAALKLIAKHRAGGGTGPSAHAAKALAAQGKRAKRKKKKKATKAAPQNAKATPAAQPYTKTGKDAEGRMMTPAEHKKYWSFAERLKRAEASAEVG